MNKQSQFAGTWPEGRAAGVVYKQSQFTLERFERQVLYGQRVMVNSTCSGLRQNKANSRRRPAGQGHGTWAGGFLPRPAPGSCTNKPNLAAWPIVRKQSQFRAGRRGGRSCQTKPICPRAGGKAIAKAGGLDDATRWTIAGPLWKTKPICPAGSGGAKLGDVECGAKRAKRSQFGRSGGGPEGEMCKTKPICPAVPGGARPRGRGTRGEPCKTKPISVPQTGARELESAPGCRRHPWRQFLLTRRDSTWYAKGRIMDD